MELNNEFEVDRSIAETWAVLTDVETIAPCLPGAQLEEIEGDEFRGFVKIKVGPITAKYKGQAAFIEKDDVNFKAVLKADGRDARQGNASAFITANLTELTPTRTKVNVDTDLTVTGKVAQFGRGVMADVSNKLLGQFVENLETQVLADQPAASAVADTSATPSSPVTGVTTPPPASAQPVGATARPNASADSNASSDSTVRKITPTTPVEPVDLLDATGAPLAKRIAPAAGAALLIMFILRMLRGRGGS